MNINLIFDPNNLDLNNYRGNAESTVDESLVQQLIEFGFNRAQSVKALQNVSSIAEAVDWIMDHPMEVSPNLQQVMDMGFNEEEARSALEETNGNVALAIEWLFGPRKKTKQIQKSDGNGTYELIAYVQHKGPSSLCGHYVTVARNGNQWVLFNDEKVSVYPDSYPPQFGKGYLYLFRRK